MPETNCYAASYIFDCSLKLKIRINNWRNVATDELYVASFFLLLLLTLMVSYRNPLSNYI
jgi:hypothetical protein